MLSTRPFAGDENALAARRTPRVRAFGADKARAGAQTAKESSRYLLGASAGPSKGQSTDVGASSAPCSARLTRPGPQRLFKDAQSLLRDKTNKTPGRLGGATPSAVKLPQSASRRKALARAQLVVSPPAPQTPVRAQPVITTPSPNPLVRARAAQLRSSPSPQALQLSQSATALEQADARLAEVPIDAEVEYAGPSAIGPLAVQEPR